MEDIVTLQFVSTCFKFNCLLVIFFFFFFFIDNIYKEVVFKLLVRLFYSSDTL